MAIQRNRMNRGGRVDRSKPLRFRFNGKTYGGYAGDTLASALLANGVSLVSRSFKLHRPRGIIAAGAEEPNAILQIGRGAATLPNQRATQVELYDGLEARSTKGWPSLRFDIAAVNNVFSRVFGAGFYYKTFMRPKALWHWYERFIRSSAGLGLSGTGLGFGSAVTGARFTFGENCILDSSVLSFSASLVVSSAGFCVS